MPNPSLPVLGTFTAVPRTTSASAAFAVGIRPYGAALQSAQNRGNGFTHIRKVCYTTVSATLLTIMRPFNWAVVASDAAINQAVINLVTNPGTYSTAFKYPNANANVPCSVADNGIAASDYCAYQLADGTWVFDTVSYVSTLAITMTTSIPNITGGGVKAGSLFYFFGVVTDKDPNTGYLNPQSTLAASATRDVTWLDSDLGIVESLHAGDPLIFYSPNTGNNGVLEYLTGYYSDR